MAFNWRAVGVSLATAAAGGLIGIVGVSAIYGSRIDRLDKGIESLDRRSAAVARLDPEQVRRCLEFSSYWKDASNHGETKAAENYSAVMEKWNCSEVMDAIRRVR